MKATNSLEYIKISYQNNAYLMNYSELAEKIKQHGQTLGFQKVGICDVDLSEHEAQLQRWLDAGYHGEMDWMARHGMMRARPDELHENTVRAISVRMDYLPPQAQFASNLADPTQAYISRYALGRDYHKMIRNKLKQLGQFIEQLIEQELIKNGIDVNNLDEHDDINKHAPNKISYRPFVDSAPILERPLAEKAGLGWVGKHSLLLDKDTGSWFFLGELLIDLPLPIDPPQQNQCGTCVACMTSCPTGAIVKEGIVDARLCISYLTIEHQGIIPEELRSKIGNRIYGCDDCQLVCPWNRTADLTQQPDFHRRDAFLDADLISLFQWTEQEFLDKTTGSAIRRIGHQQWLRNIAIALGNAPYSKDIIKALTYQLDKNELSNDTSILDEHIKWALTQQQNKLIQSSDDLKNPSQRNPRQERLIRIIEKGLPRDA